MALFRCATGRNLETYSFSTPIGFSEELRFQKISIGLRVRTKCPPDISPSHAKIRLTADLLARLTGRHQNQL